MTGTRQSTWAKPGQFSQHTCVLTLGWEAECKSANYRNIQHSRSPLCAFLLQELTKLSVDLCVVYKEYWSLNFSAGR